MWRQTHQDGTDKNNNLSFEGLDPQNSRYSFYVNQIYVIMKHFPHANNA